MEEKVKVKTGIFGGSFNPPHIGHLAIANYLCEFGGLDEIWFMVSPHNPLKKHSSLMADELRLELMQLAIVDYPKFKVSDFEFSLPRPSYTLNTLTALQRTYPDREFTLIIGADNWHLFHNWKDSEIIKSTFPIIVFPREGYHIDKSTLPGSIILADSPIIEISSTFIRKSINLGKDVRFFLPPAVYERLMAEKQSN